MYWDQIDQQYKPAKRVHVEVEGDWWWRFDPDVTTDDEGYYEAKVGNPPWWWGDYDGVDIEVYADTDNVVQVYEAWYSWYPYHIISKVVNNVGDNETVTIDVRIGGPNSLNIAEAYYRSESETANAFVVHQTILDYYLKLRNMGFPQSCFDEVEVIIPAMTPSGISYYNFVTGYINIAMDSAGLSGYGNWKVLPTHGISYANNYNSFKMTLQHEYAHNIHDESTGAIPPLGLGMPAVHSIDMLTNQYLAYTEGFAAFLPLAVNDIRLSHLDWSRADGIHTPIDFPSGPCLAMEGQVAGVLFDIWDPVGYEICRYGVEHSVDNIPVPDLIYRNQKFKDRIRDANLEKIRTIMVKQPLASSLSPVQTIAEFLYQYYLRYPEDRHAIKAIAYNRGITLGMPGEEPAVIHGSPKLKRWGRTITMQFTIREPDLEDRPYVWADMYYQEKDTGHLKRLSGIPESPSWTGTGLRSVNHSFELPQIYADDGYFWLILTDDMLPVVYRFNMPIARQEYLANVAYSYANDSRKLAIQQHSPTTNPDKILVPGVGAAVDVQQFSASTTVATEAVAQTMDVIRKEARAYEERRTLMERQERGFYKLSTRLGGVSASSSADEVYKRKTGQLNTVQKQDRAKYLAWKQQIKQGGRLNQPLVQADLQLLQQHRSRLDQLIEEQNQCAAKLSNLQQLLDQKLAAVQLGPQSARLKQITLTGSALLNNKLTTISQDRVLSAKLEEARTVLTAITQPQIKRVVPRRRR